MSPKRALPFHETDVDAGASLRIPLRNLKRASQGKSVRDLLRQSVRHSGGVSSMTGDKAVSLSA
jgi:hypothetical protein